MNHAEELRRIGDVIEDCGMLLSIDAAWCHASANYIEQLEQELAQLHHIFDQMPVDLEDLLAP